MVDQHALSVIAAPSYSAIHAAARRSMDTSCTTCGATGLLHAALRPETPDANLLVDPRSGCRYSVDPIGDYAALCPPCHWRQDQADARFGKTCGNGHEYTPENTRTKRTRNGTVRKCVACYRVGYAKWNAKVQQDPERYAAKRAADCARAARPEVRERRNARLRAQRAEARAARSAT